MKKLNRPYRPPSLRALSPPGDPFVSKFKSSCEFVWAYNTLVAGPALHAIAEEQVGSTQEAFCGDSPPVGTRWARADKQSIDTVKCPRCLLRIRGRVDRTIENHKAVRGKL